MACGKSAVAIWTIVHVTLLKCVIMLKNVYELDEYLRELGLRCCRGYNSLLITIGKHVEHKYD